MNEIYLVIMAVVTSVTIILWYSFDKIIDCFIGLFGIMLLSIVSVIMIIISGICNTGNDLIEIKPATNTRVGDELIIQAQGYPTQVVSNIALIDKSVQVKKVTMQNAWGGGLETKYVVEPIN